MTSLRSVKPRKNRLLNFFDVGERYRLVDTPGYGYSKRSGDEQASWQKMMETYVLARDNLRGILLIMDCRRDWDEDEKILIRFCKKQKLPVMIALNKADKLKPHEREQSIKRIQQASAVSEVLPVSAATGFGVEEFEKAFFLAWLSQRKPKD